jgi:GTP cyclohydrolase III
VKVKAETTAEIVHSVATSISKTLVKATTTQVDVVEIMSRAANGVLINRVQRAAAMEIKIGVEIGTTEQKVEVIARSANKTMRHNRELRLDKLVVKERRRG